MWVARELVRLVERVLLAFGVAFLIAVVWALVSQYTFAHALHVTTLVMGALLLLMGAMGRDSNFERRLDNTTFGRDWRPARLSRRHDDPTLRPGLVLALSGVALLAVGFVLVTG